MMRTMFSLALLMEKTSEAGTLKMVNGFDLAFSPEEAKGRLVSKSLDEHQGYCVRQVLCMEVPLDAIHSYNEQVEA